MSSRKLNKENLEMGESGGVLAGLPGWPPTTTRSMYLFLVNY